MLSLQLKSGEYLTIGDEIAVQIFEESGSTFRVAVKAPREIPILRGEVLERTGERIPAPFKSEMCTFPKCFFLRKISDVYKRQGPRPR